MFEARRFAGTGQSRVHACEAISLLEPLEVRVLLAGGLCVTALTPTGGVDHPFQSLRVQFDRAVQAGTFTAADVSATGLGGPIAALVTQVDATTYDITLAGANALANYSLVFGPDIRDQAGQQMDQDHDGTPGEAGQDAYSAKLIAAGISIPSGNVASDGLNLLLYGGSSTIDGAHAFASISLAGGAVLAHSADTDTNVYSLDLTIRDGLTIDATSRIDVSGQGYIENHTDGNTIGQTSGGSYGGVGFALTATPGKTYGDYRNPDQPGGGGWGNQSWPGGSGGGLVRISAATADIDGTIAADGSGTGWGTAGGAGGGIWLSVGTLSGDGAITADGANSDTPGGGGRVAIYYDNLTDFDLGSVLAVGGGRPGNNWYAAPGTVYLKQTGQDGLLRINNNGLQAGMWTSLGGPADAQFDEDTVQVSGQGVTVRPDHQMPLHVTDLTLSGGAALTSVPTTDSAMGWVDLTVDGTLTVASTSKIDVSGQGYLPGRTTGNSTNNAATDQSGGSYGGLGGAYYTYDGHPWTTGLPYGDYKNPTEVGSGGGGGDNIYGNPTEAGSGGGLVRISAANAIIDGTIVADGVSGYDGGAGAGGGVWLNVGTLSGAGSISADGASGIYHEGAGGGGRVAVYYDTLDGFDLGEIQALPGQMEYSDNGSTGTVYLEQTGQQGQLRIDSKGLTTNHWTPLGLPGDDVFTVPDLVIMGEGTVAAAQHQMPIHAANVTISGKGNLAHRPATATETYWLDLTVSGTLTVAADGSIDVTGLGYLPGRSEGNSSLGGARSGAGSYGGVGYTIQDFTGGQAYGKTYGDYRNPTEPGSGGGNRTSSPGTGGGLVRISAAVAVIDGEIFASGEPSDSAAGSGGGIWLSVGTLSGTGDISAPGGGGHVTYGYGSTGGGGRVAVYYDTLDGFDLNNITALPGTPTWSSSTPAGGVGTVYLKQANQSGNLIIDSHDAATNTWTTLGTEYEDEFTADNLLISGAGVVVVPQHSSMLIRLGSLHIASGAMLSHLPSDNWYEQSLNVVVSGQATIDYGSSIDVSGRGYLPGYSLGNAKIPPTTAGGSYGGRGGGASHAAYGNPEYPNDLGIGGQYTWTSSSGNSGGGLVHLTAGSLQFDGSILALGGGELGSAASGAAGGGILINAGSISGNGIISANGGAGFSGGGGGRVAIYSWLGSSLPASHVSAHGGATEVYAGKAGQDGSVTYPAGARYFLATPSNKLFHDQETLRWDVLGIDPASVTVDVEAIQGGVATPVAVGADPSGGVAWDTTALADGDCQIHATFRDADGNVLGESTDTVSIFNAVAWRGGLITGNQTWSADKTNVVDRDAALAPGATLDIEPGAIVKFAPGARLIVSNGATLNMPATVIDPIVLTALADDTIGGDSDPKAPANTQPQMWGGISPEAGGTVNLNNQVQFRYITLQQSGTLTDNTFWPGNCTYEIISYLTIPTGITLTIAPGAIVKFDRNTGIQVNGTLAAPGLISNPIVFTSIKDDTVGGDSDYDGGAQKPAAGDWININVSGSLSMDYCQVRYGGGGGANHMSASLRAADPGGSEMTISNSIISDSFFDGVVAISGCKLSLTNSVLLRNDEGVWADGQGEGQIIANCTIDGNRVGIAAANSAQIVNCLITNNRQSGISGGGDVRSSDVWSPKELGSTNYWITPDLTGQNGNISVDPKYRDSENGDYRLNYLSPAIDAGDGSVAPATDIMGAPRYDDPRTANTGTPPGNDFVDMGAYEFADGAPSDIDLTAGDVSGQAAAAVGDKVVIQWTETNIGTAPAVGPWHSAIYLSLGGMNTPGGSYLADEPLVGEGITLQPGQSIQFMAEVTVPAGFEGANFWEVTANSRNEVFEGQNRANNTGDSSATVNVSYPELTVDASATVGQFDQSQQAKWFVIHPGRDGQDIRLNLGLSGSGITELYVAGGRPATRDDYDLSATLAQGSQQLQITGAQTGVTYYVMAYATNVPAATSFSLAAVTPVYGIDEVTPSQVGNVGNVTLSISGSEIPQGVQPVLVGPDGKTYYGGNVDHVSPTQIYATFDLAGAVENTYDLRLIAPDGTVTTETGAVQVVLGHGPRLQADVIVPAIIRAGRPYSFQVQYSNQGDTDLIAPILTLTTSDKRVLGFSPGENDGEGELDFLGYSSTGPAGILRPGQTEVVTIYSMASVNDLNMVYYNLTSQCVDPLHPRFDVVDWDSLANKYGAGSALNTAGFWETFTRQMGGTWDAVNAELANILTRQAQSGGRVDPVVSHLMQSAVALAGERGGGLTDDTPPSILWTIPYDGNGLNFIDVIFSKTIDASTFTAADITITTPDGKNITPIITAQNGRVYTISFQSGGKDTTLKTSGDYQFAIGPDIADLNGLTMDQDGDGRTGEVVDDVYRTIFHVEGQVVSPILHVVSQSPNGRVDVDTGAGLSDVPGANPAIPGPYTPGIDHLMLQFSRPVQFLTFSPQDVTVKAPDGSDVPVTGLREISSTIWEVDFVRQTTLGQYTVKVGTGIKDNYGYDLDQDMNGVGGEGDQDSYSGTFTLVDVHGPRVVARSPGEYLLGPTDHIDVTFDEAVAAASFTAADVTLTGPSGAVVVSGITQLDARSFRIQLAAPLAQQGEYDLAIGPNITDLAGNAMDQDQDGANGTGTDAYTSSIAMVVDPQSTVEIDAGVKVLQGSQPLGGADPADHVVLVGTISYTGILANFFPVPHVRVQLWRMVGAKDNYPGYANSGDAGPDVLVNTTSVLTGSSDVDAKGQFVFNSYANGQPLLKSEAVDGVPMVPQFYVIVVAENDAATIYDGMTTRIINSNNSPLWTQFDPEGKTSAFYPKAFVESSSWMPGAEKPGFNTQVHDLSVQINNSLFTPLEWIKFGRKRLTDDFGVPGRRAISVIGNYPPNPEEAFYNSGSDVIVLGANQTKYPAAVMHEYGHSIQNALNGYHGLDNPASPTSGNVVGGGTFDTWYGIIQESSEFAVDAAGHFIGDFSPPIYHADQAYCEAWASFVAAWTVRGQAIWGLGINDKTDAARSLPMFLNHNNWWMGFDAFGYDKNSNAGDSKLDPGDVAAAWWLDGNGINKNANTGDKVLGGVLTTFWDIAKSGPNGPADLWNAFKAASAGGSTAYTFWNALPHTDAYKAIFLDNGMPLTDGGLAVDDKYEENDTRDSAVDITPVTDVSGNPLGPVSLDGLVMAESAAGAGDWFKFDVVGDQYADADATRDITIQLDWDTNYGYLDIYAQNTTTGDEQMSIAKRDMSGHILLAFPDLKATEDYHFVVGVAGYGALNADGTASAFGGDYVPDYSLVLNWGGVPAPSDDKGPKPPPPPPFTWPEPEDNDHDREGAAHDPNALVGPAGVGDDGYIPAGQVMPYTVEFENSGPQATLPAQTVNVTNQLDSHLDWSSFALTEINFGSHTIPVPAGMQHFHTTCNVTSGSGQPIVVDIDAGINVATGLVYCNFTTLDPGTGQLPLDPTAGFLPVNDANHSGEGYFSYVVNQKDALTSGQQITNQASIVFDTNPAIVTNTYLNTIDTAPPISQVTSTSGSVGADRLELSWSASDQGSGLDHVELYASDNGGDYALVYQGSGWNYDFAAQPGHTYRFYTVAVDAVGQREAAPAQPDAQISIWNTVSQTLQGKTNKLAFTDADGTPVTITYAGVGSGVVERWDNPDNHQGDIRSVTITNPDGKGTLTVATKGKGAAAATSIGDIIVHSSLKSIVAKTANLLGDLTVDGTLGVLTMDDAVGGSAISIGPRPAGDTKTATAVTFDRLADLSIVSQTPLASLTATEWIDSDQTADVLQAPWLGKLTTKGDKVRFLAGGFEADLSLSGAGVAAKKPTLGPVAIAGGMSGATWDITGSMATLKVGGLAGGWLPADAVAVRTSGGMGALTFGSVRDADFLAGVSPAAAGDAAITRRADALADFTNASAAIASVTIKPAKGALGTMFANSNFSAAGIGTVTIVDAWFNNDQAGLTDTQDDFGLWSKTIKSVKHTDLANPKDKAKNWTWKPGATLPANLDDLNIKALIV